MNCLPHKPDPAENSYDVIVIGAGITGSWLIRELSRYEGRFAILDKEPMPGFGVTKGGLSQIHAPDFTPSGTLKAQFCRDATRMFQKTARELDLPFRKVDELWLALEPAHIADLEAGKQRGEALDAREFTIIGPEKIRELEPHITSKALAALYVRDLGAIHPPEWTFALVENARQNSARVFLNTSVNHIRKDPAGGFTVETSRGTIQSKYIINAAGLFADDIAKMVGDHHIRLILTKGTMAIMDKAVSHLTRHMVYGTFSSKHSQVIAPTAHGNLIAGLGHFTEPAGKTDTKVETGKLAEVIKMGQELIPALSEKDVITSFAGIKSENNRVEKGDHYIAPSDAAEGVIHALVSSPGLTGAPYISEFIITLLSDAGFILRDNPNFEPHRLSWKRLAGLDPKEKQELMCNNPKYAHILCRCEKISKAEIVQAIHRGADTMDGVKHLTRAGMGRCQGGFCGPSVLQLLCDETGRAPGAVTKKGKGSHIVVGETRNDGGNEAVDQK